jgi:hypothetical protein
LNGAEKKAAAGKQDEGHRDVDNYQEVLRALIPTCQSTAAFFECALHVRFRAPERRNQANSRRRQRKRQLQTE